MKRVEQHVKGDTFIVTYGDGLSDVDIKKLLAFHQSHGKLVTVTTVQPVSRFGITMIDGQSRVTGFSEKPKVEGWVSAGFFVFNRRIFDYLDGGELQILENEPLEKLAAEGQLMAYKHDGFFFGSSGFSVGRGCPCHVSGRSLLPSRQPLTACPRRSDIRASACFHSPATWQGHPLPEPRTHKIL